ncbi:MAG: tetratricopeptide repeat protein [Acidobacteriota bacterium]|nr:tetratricopeptide repeat protein [Acidobacteriota bacterium]
MKKPNLKNVMVFLLIFVLTFGGVLPVRADGDLVGGAAEDISGNASVFVFRKGRKAPHAKKSFGKNTVSARNRRQKTAQYAVIKARLKNSLAKNRTKARTANNSAATAGAKNSNRRAAPTIKNVEPLLAKADAALAQGDFAGAIQSYTKVLAISPKNPRALAGLSDGLTAKGDRAAETGNTAQAIANYEEALKYDSQNTAAYAGLGAVYDTTDEREKAVANFEKALQLDVSLVDVYYPLGVLYFETKNYSKAEEYLNKALPARADDAETRNYVGLIYANSKRDAEAVKAFRLAAELKPDYAEAYFNLGESYDRLNQLDEAIGAYRKALEINPNYAEAWFNLGVAYYNRERYPDAAEAYKQAAALTGDVETNLNLADAFRQLKQFDSANVAYEKAIAQNTAAPAAERAEVFEKYGYCLGKANRWEDSVNALNETSQLNPDSVTYANLSWTYSNSAKEDAKNKNEAEARRKLEESKKAAQKAAELDSKNEAAKFNLGNALAQLGEYDSAIENFRQAVSMRSGWAEGFNGLGVAYRLSGDLNNAAEAFNQALRLNNDFADAHLNMAIVETGRGNKRQAKRHQDEVKRLNPAMAVALDVFLRTVLPAQLKRRAIDKIPGKNKVDQIRNKIPLPF